MQNDYILMVDDNCDMPVQFYKDNDIAVLKMNYNIDGVTYYEGDRTPEEFYELVRAGKLATTALANAEEIKAVMEPHLEAGKDVLYLAFGSGLSGTAHNGIAAAAELSEKYPGRKVITVDTLCASMGEGLLLYKANLLKQKGMPIDELADWAVKNRLSVVSLVMADDLMHLHRGGRVSKASAIAGSVLGIKPIIHLNDDGKLIPIEKVRGKKQALKKLVDMAGDRIGGVKNDYFMVSHADCFEDAQFVADLMVERFGIKDYMINFIGPVVGTHTGCGTIALFFMGERR